MFDQQTNDPEQDNLNPHDNTNDVVLQNIDSANDMTIDDIPR